jgi:hypothetical protein
MSLLLTIGVVFEGQAYFILYRQPKISQGFFWLSVIVAVIFGVGALVGTVFNDRA